MNSCVSALIAALLVSASVAQADIISWQCSGDGALTCSYTGLANAVDGSYDMTISTAQRGPGSITSCITATADDPTAVMLHEITNDTGSDWFKYSGTIELYSLDPLSSPQLYGASVTLPVVGWSGSVTQNFQSVLSDMPGWYEYQGSINYSGGTPIANGSNLNFQYTEQFSGSPTYFQIEKLSPVYAVPEPGSLAMLAATAVMGLLYWRRRNRG
jgi:hypothetical protein